MKVQSRNSEQVILTPETIEEAGVMQWLAMRFKGPVTLQFDTTQFGENYYHPALWIRDKPEAVCVPGPYKGKL